MLPKKRRFPIQLFVGKKGKLVKTPYFWLRIYSSDWKFSRFGVTVSSKTAKKATERNRLRRMIYNFLQSAKDKLPIADYWIAVLPNAAGLPKNKFIEELEKAFNG